MARSFPNHTNHSLSSSSPPPATISGVPPDYLALRDDAREALQADAPDEAARMLHLCGYSWGQIARLTGYARWQDAHKAVVRLVKAEQLMQRDLRQQMEYARLLRLEQKLQPQVEQGSVEAIKTALEVSKERRRLLADDEPARQPTPALPTLDEAERAAGAMAAALGQDPQRAMAHFRQIAQRHGYLPSSTERSQTEVGVEMDETLDTEAILDPTIEHTELE